VVSPSVWGWRENRIKVIASYIDLTMCLFQFEHEFYLEKEIKSFFLGHPFSSIKPSALSGVLKTYQLNSSQDFVCILPGSRKSEVLYMMPIFIKAAERIFDINPNTFFLIPAANSKLKALIKTTLENTRFNYQLTSSAAKDYLSISKISIVTSGTASLEAAVLGSLPIICYKTNSFNYAILSRMIKTPFIGLPNLLLQKHIFPELIQHELTPEAIVHHYEDLSSNTHKYQPQIEEMILAMKGKGVEEAAHLLKSL
jgi:lipid-A-disaccharide synthase